MGSYVVERRPISLNAGGMAVMFFAIGAALGVLARFLAVQGVAHGGIEVLLGRLTVLPGLWLLGVVLIARVCAKVGTAVIRSLMLVAGAVLGHFAFGANFFSDNAAAPVEARLAAVLVLVPLGTAALWWGSHRSWSAAQWQQFLGGAVLAVPPAVIAAEMLALRGQVPNTGMLVAAVCLAVLAAGVLFMSVRTITAAIGVAVGLWPAYLVFGYLSTHLSQWLAALAPS